MKGVTFSFDDQQLRVIMTVEVGEMESELDAKVLFDDLLLTEFSDVYLSQTTLKNTTDKANHHFKTEDKIVITEDIGERRNAEVAFKISDDEMEAVLSLTAPYGGQYPSVKAVVALAAKNNIKRGVSTKRIKQALEELKQVTSGEVVETLVAKGLPSKDGHSSFMNPLVPNALERVLRPQTTESGKADLRNLGDIICVKANVPVVRRMPPSDGRAGFTVKGTKIDAQPGKWLPIKLGNGTVVSDDDENLILSAHSGMPKFQNLTMSVDDTFICNGVNVGSGHVNYDGAVLVNGDVTEKMKVVATGDVTVNGFVESGYIDAGGDIIITEGAMGKEVESSQEQSCVLKARGSIHVQHGQGIQIICNNNVSIGRQLAHSRIRCGGGVVVGQPDQPRGNLFGCEIESQDSVIAGTLGAVSGSTLRIDFSEGFNALNARLDEIDDLLKQLRENNLRHKEKLDVIAKKHIPKPIRTKVSEAKELFENETAMLQWIEDKAQALRDAKANYLDSIKIVANKKLYSGVSLKLNNRTWRSEREYDRAKVHYREHQWTYEPVV